MIQQPPSPDHTRLGAGGLLTCERCGGTSWLGLPCKLNIAAARSRQFVTEHANCPPKGEPKP